MPTSKHVINQRHTIRMSRSGGFLQVKLLEGFFGKKGYGRGRVSRKQ